MQRVVTTKRCTPARCNLNSARCTLTRWFLCTTTNNGIICVSAAEQGALAAAAAAGGSSRRRSPRYLGTCGEILVRTLGDSRAASEAPFGNKRTFAGLRFVTNKQTSELLWTPRRKDRRPHPPAPRITEMYRNAWECGQHRNA